MVQGLCSLSFLSRVDIKIQSLFSFHCYGYEASEKSDFSASFAVEGKSIVTYFSKNSSVTTDVISRRGFPMPNNSPSL